MKHTKGPGQCYTLTKYNQKLRYEQRLRFKSIRAVRYALGVQEGTVRSAIRNGFPVKGWTVDIADE